MATHLRATEIPAVRDHRVAAAYLTQVNAPVAVGCVSQCKDVQLEVSSADNIMIIVSDSHSPLYIGGLYCCIVLFGLFALLQTRRCR